MRLKERKPEMYMYVLFRDIRTCGEREASYREARSKEIPFIRYGLEEKPRVEIQDDNLRVTLIDQMLQMPVQIDADIITLASAIVPSEDLDVLKEAPQDDSPRAVIGIRPCDARAFKLVDVNFDTQEYRDPLWLRGWLRGWLRASGHNPRGDKIQRVRQRFMHKLKYYVDKYKNGVACVGCGRCVQHCPVNIDIRQVFQLMHDTNSKTREFRRCGNV